MTRKKRDGVFTLEELLNDTELKKSLQDMLITNDELTRKVFTAIQKSNRYLIENLEGNEYFDKVIEQKSKKILKDGHLSNQEFAEFVLSLIFNTTRQMHENQLRTSQLLELVTLNTIELKQNLNELLHALSSGDSKRQIARIKKGMKFEEEEYRRKLAAVKKSTRVTQWWGRRLDDMAEERANNERI